ncbi:MAG: hypothetical protein M0T69_12340 [Deltaproteobacteria bacterium]|nr:hypothetical protein [Deltaproteobacteria bacterium]
MGKHILSVIGYIAATFATQATSHFLLFAQHYSAVPYIKSDPIFALGFLSMIIQGAVLSVVFAQSRFSGKSVFHGVVFAWLFGAFLVSYIGLAEAAKYAVPSVPSWIGVEFLVGSAQFTIAGIFLGLAHRRTTGSSA